MLTPTHLTESQRSGLNRRPRLWQKPGFKVLRGRIGFLLAENPAKRPAERAKTGGIRQQNGNAATPPASDPAYSVAVIGAWWAGSMLLTLVAYTIAVIAMGGGR